MEALRSWADLLSTTQELNSGLARSIAGAYPSTPDFMEQTKKRSLLGKSRGKFPEMNKPRFFAVLPKAVYSSVALKSLFSRPKEKADICEWERTDRKELRRAHQAEVKPPVNQQQ